MKVQIKIEGDYYEDREILNDVLKTQAFRSVIEEFFAETRKILKYEDHSEEVCNVVERIRTHVWDAAVEEGINLE